MAIPLKINFLFVLHLVNYSKSVNIANDGSRKWNRQYFDNWFTYFAFVYTGVRSVESLIITRNKSNII